MNNNNNNNDDYKVTINEKITMMLTMHIDNSDNKGNLYIIMI